MNSLPLNLLLADDDLDDCTFFKEALEELPVAVKLKTVNDGVELMQLLTNETQTLPDVVYLDLNMPRKNGFDCLNEIRRNEKLKEVPVIIFSTSFDKEAVDLLHENGASYYICKPAVFDELKKIILKSLNLVSNLSNEQLPKQKFVLTAT